MNKNHTSKWPTTPNKLIHETIFYINKISNLIKQEKEYEIKPWDLIKTLEFVVRSNHIKESINNNAYLEENNRMLRQLIEVLNKQKIKTLIQKRFEDHIISYRGWVDILFSLEKKEDLEEYDNLLDIRDAIQGEMEILEMMNINILESKEKIAKIDQDFKSIGPKLGYKFLNNISKQVFPEKIYWWWYLGGINNE